MNLPNSDTDPLPAFDGYEDKTQDALVSIAADVKLLVQLLTPILGAAASFLGAFHRVIGR